jgi:hypothetical protein
MEHFGDLEISYLDLATECCLGGKGVVTIHM